MKITIEIDTCGEPSPEDQRVLNALAGKGNVIPVDMPGAEPVVRTPAEPSVGVVTEKTSIQSAQETFSSVEVEEIIPPEKKQELAQQVFQTVAPVVEQITVDQPATIAQTHTNTGQTTGFSDNVGNAAVEVDDHNYPHHPEIHTANKSKMGSGKRAGCFKYKPKYDKELAAKIEAEDRANGFGPGEHTELATTPVIPNPNLAASTVPVPDVQPPVIEPVNTAPTPQETDEALTYVGLFSILSKDVSNGLVPQGVQNCIAQGFGLENPMQLNSHPELVVPFKHKWDKVKALLTLHPDVKDGLVANWNTYVTSGHV